MRVERLRAGTRIRQIIARAPGNRRGRGRSTAADLPWAALSRRRDVEQHVRAAHVSRLLVPNCTDSGSVGRFEAQRVACSDGLGSPGAAMPLNPIVSKLRATTNVALPGVTAPSQTRNRWCKADWTCPLR